MHRVALVSMAPQCPAHCPMSDFEGVPAGTGQAGGQLPVTRQMSLLVVSRLHAFHPQLLSNVCFNDLLISCSVVTGRIPEFESWSTLVV